MISWVLRVFVCFHSHVWPRRVKYLLLYLGDKEKEWTEAPVPRGRRGSCQEEDNRVGEQKETADPDLELWCGRGR